MQVSVLANSNVVTADYDGSLSVEDEKVFQDAMKKVIDQHGAANVLLTVGEIDWGRIEPAAAWEDLKSATLLDGVAKVAVVTDASWVSRVSEWAATLTSLPVQAYPSDQRDDALAWLAAEPR